MASSSRVSRFEYVLVLVLAAYNGCSGSRSSVLRPRQFNVAGQISSNGRPLVGATVSAHPVLAGAVGTTTDATARSDAEGTFALALPPGRYLVESQDSNQAPVAAIVSTGSSAKISLTLATVPGGQLAGRVRDVDGGPVAGAVVTVEGELPIGTIVRDWRPVSARTSDTGDFKLGPLRPGVLRITAHHAGFRNSDPAFVYLPLAGRSDGVMLTLDRGFELSGTVVDRSRRSRPLGGVIVEAIDQLTGSVVVAAGPSAADGHFTIGGLHAGTVVLDVRQEGALPAWTGTRVTLPGRNVNGIVVAASPTFIVEGTVAGAPGRITIERLPNASESTASSTVGRSAVETDTSGHFAFRSVSPGRFTLHARSADGTCFDAPIEVTDHDVRDVTFHAVNRGSIIGLVRDANGNGVAHARVGIASAVLSAGGWRSLATGRLEQAVRESIGLASHHLQTRQEMTASDGSFEASCLESGPFEMIAALGDAPLTWKDPARQGGPNTPMTVELEASAKTKQVELDVQSCEAAVMGKLVDKSGAPKAGAFVAAFADNRSSGARSAGSAITNAAGKYRIGQLCQGRYRLIAHALDGEWVAISTLVEVKAGETEEVPLQLGDPAAVRGAPKAGNSPVKSFGLLLEGSTDRARRFGSPDGEFVEPLLIPGTYAAIVEADEGYGVRSLELRPGETDLGAWQLVPWSAIVGRVTNEIGQPVPDLPVQIWFDWGSTSEIPDRWPGPGRFRTVRTDAAGHFSVDRVPARQVRLTVGDPGREHLVVRVSGATGEKAAAERFPRLGVHVTPKRGENLDMGTVVVELRR